MVALSRTIRIAESARVSRAGDSQKPSRVANFLPGSFTAEIIEITESEQHFEIRSAPTSLTASIAALPSMSLNPFAPFSVSSYPSWLN